MSARATADFPGPVRGGTARVEAKTLGGLARTQWAVSARAATGREGDLMTANSSVISHGPRETRTRPVAGRWPISCIRQADADLAAPVARKREEANMDERRCRPRG